MTGEDVVAMLALFEAHDLNVTVDGGWAVDALLGEQTRPHGDLDIAIPHSQVAALRILLCSEGFREIPRDDSWECNFVLADEVGRKVDVHAYELDADGNNISGITYLAADLNGVGAIAGRTVRCVPLESLVRFHTGYIHDANDARDVKALCDRFKIELPAQYMD